MYLGKKADTLVENENMFNVKASETDVADQWVFMKYHIENRNNKELDVSEILSCDNFYKYSGNSILVMDTATISNDKKDIYNTLAPGAEDDFWLGLLIPKSNGMPYLALNDFSIFLNTNPDLLSGLKKPGHSFKLNEKWCTVGVCGGVNPNYNAALNAKLVPAGKVGELSVVLHGLK